MDYFLAKINELATKSTGAKKSFVRTFIAAPPEVTLLNKGTLFGLFEVNSGKHKMLELVDVVIEEIQDNYYSVALPDGEADLENAFETALQKTNLAVAAFLENVQLAADLEHVNAVIGLQFHKELYLAPVGSLGLFLFQRLAKSGYRIINILDVSRTPLATPNPLKLFSQVITGGIGSRDVAALMTSSFLDYFSLERLKNILTQADGISELQRSINEFKTDCNFGIISLQIEKRSQAPSQAAEQAAASFNYQVAASHDSMRELDRTERETAKLLTPSVFPEVKQYVTVIRGALQRAAGRLKTTALKKTRQLKRVIKTPSRSAPGLSQTPMPPLSAAPRQKPLGYQFKPPQVFHFSKKITQRLQTLSSLRAIGTAVSRVAARLPRVGLPKVKLPAWVVTLRTSSKIFLLVGLVLGGLFLQSVIGGSISRRRAQAVETFNQLMLEAETKKNEAEASLIYRDENKAREILADISDRLASSEPPTKAQREQVALLQRQIEEQLQGLRHLVTIDEPILLGNFQNIDSQADVAAVLTLIGGTLYTQNRNNQSLYKINTQTRTMSSTYSSEGGLGTFQLGIVTGPSEILLIDEARQAYVLTPGSDSIKKIELPVTGQTAIADVTIFNNRLYLLDSAENQIYRYQRSSGGYAGRTAWARDDQANFTDATSLTVDGSAYVLHRSGSIEKFENGTPVEFGPVVIDPVLVSPTKIKTSPESKYLYVLDPSTKRLVVLDKEGRLISQYTSDQFSDLKDFAVAEAEKKIYLLNGSSVFGIPAEHLE